MAATMLRFAPLILVLAAAPPARGMTAEESLWALLARGGHVVLMRHTSTVPITGDAFDPPGFRLEDCATQRLLSPLGREEAQGIGASFRFHRVPVGRVLSSRWCRCLDTARLAFGAVEPWPALDSFFHDHALEPAQTRQLRERVSARPANGNLVLVTHSANVTALTGIRPEPGEMVILAAGGANGFRVAGRLHLSVRPSG
jgi:phosphohistidine phosphatase SixA